MSIQFCFKKFCLSKYNFNIKIFLFQTIQFSINTQFSSIELIDRGLSVATTRDHCGPGSDGNEGVLRIPQISSIIGTSPSDSLVPYPGHSLWVGGCHPLPWCCWCILQPNLLVYSTAKAIWAIEDY